MKEKDPYISLSKQALLLLLFLSSVPALAQNPDRELLSYEVKQDVVLVEVNDGQYIFKPYTPEIMETTFIPSGEKPEPDSHAVVLEPAEMDLEVSEDDASVKINSEGIQVVITKHPFQVTYYFGQDKVISEKKGFSKEEEHEEINFNLEEYELLFGGGARALGMNRRGHRLVLYNRAHYGYTTRSELLNYTLPIVLSSEKYLLHFDNAPVGHLDLDSENSNELAYETIGGRKTYQLVVGDSWERIIENYTLLTGRQPLPPRWALGNFSSRFGYHSQGEVEETIRKFKEESIPVDAVILDLFWFGHDIKGTMGNLEFVKDSFPEPKKMMSGLADKGVKTILVTEPFILTTSNRWEESVQEEVLATDSLGEPFTYDFYFGNTGLIDIFKPKAQEWFWDIYKGLKDEGVAGWWGDLGEPEVHPSELQHSIGAADEVHNIYGHYWAKLIYEGYQKDFPEHRPFILMRAGASGSQRFGLIPWSGDVNRSWGGLKPQPEISLQMGMQGLAYMHSDLGGFAGDLLDNELYVRWLQYGVFQPLYRPHAQEEVASEPVFKEPATKALAKKAIELRYRLLPYNYTWAFKNSQTGIPFMRPLFFEEPENYRLFHISNTYLWGEDFLISPVMNPDVSTLEIYFPVTSNWFDFYTDEKYEKGSRATMEVKEESIPTFVRGGAFIPLAKPMQTTADYSVAALDLHYYYDQEVASSSADIYHDDGITSEAFEKGLFEILHLRSENLENELTLYLEKEVGDNFDSEFDSLEVVIHNIAGSENVTIQGKKTKFRWNENEKKLRFEVAITSGTTVIKIITD